LLSPEKETPMEFEEMDNLAEAARSNSMPSHASFAAMGIDGAN